jgi:hypothetical protein
MKWKELIIGALVTLLITTVGGIIVWKFTKEPPKPEPAPYIAYQMDTPAKFKSESKSLVFNTVRIGNLGDKLAQKIVLSVEFPDQTEINDFSISNSSGPAARDNQNDLKSKENEKIIKIDSLMPNELITLSILTNSYDGDPKVTVRYPGGLAEQGSLSKRTSVQLSNEGPEAKWAALSALILGLLLPIMLYRLKRISGGFRSINNSAFVMLHQGLIADATKMLENELSSRGATSFELANLGLCKALSGDIDTASKLYSAAELYSQSKHIKVLVAFNRAISSFEEGDLAMAKKQFLTASDLNKRRIKEYVKYSVYGQSLVKGIDGFDEFIPVQS